MATYKGKFKKQSSDLVLLKVILGIILSVLVLVAIAFIYDASTKWKNYDYYTGITEYNGIFDYTNGGTEELNNYVVYFYSKTCSNCASVKAQVLKDGKNINKDGDIFFIADTDAMTDGDDYLSTFLDDINMVDMVTPMLVVVVNGEFYEVYAGSSSVTNVLDSIESGDYAPFN